MEDIPDPAKATPFERPRRYWIDDDGNVHGVVLTVDAAHFTEIKVQAINYPLGTRREDLKG